MNNMLENTKNLTMKTLNPRVIDVEYAVRGPIVIRAAEIEKEIKSVEKYSFNKILLFIYFSRVSITFHLIVLFERILAIAMLVVIKYRLHIFVKFVLLFFFYNKTLKYF